MSDTFEVEVGPKGRVVIPAPIRRELGIEEDTRLVALVDQGAVVLAPRHVLRRRLRAMFAGVEGSLADELLADRRAEASAETE